MRYGKRGKGPERRRKRPQERTRRTCVSSGPPGLALPRQQGDGGGATEGEAGGSGPGTGDPNQQSGGRGGGRKQATK